MKTNSRVELGCAMVVVARMLEPVIVNAYGDYGECEATFARWPLLSHVNSDGLAIKDNLGYCFEKGISLSGPFTCHISKKDIRIPCLAALYH